jgi:hypothetical protein
MENGAEGKRTKMQYSTPSLIPDSLNGVAARMREKHAENGHSAGNHLLWPGIYPPPLIIDGFTGDVRDLDDVLLSLGSQSQLDSEDARAKELETESDPNRAAPAGGFSIFLVDMRLRSERRQPLTRIETDSDIAGTLTIILTDSGEDFVAGNEIRPADRWRFSGPITAAGLGVLVASVLQMWAVQTEALAHIAQH